MEVIELNKNCVTTECGHCFHTNCLMKSIVHNGFGCPYCRSVMAEVPEEDDEETLYSDVSDEDQDEEVYNDDALRGLRFFTNNIQGIAHDQEDIEAENEFLEEQEEEQNNELVPSIEYVSNKLREQDVSYEQLVSLLLNRDHEEYENDIIERIDGEIFGKIRIIVSNYDPTQIPLPQVEAPVVTQTEPIQRPIDFEAQPKTRRPITHV